MAFPDLLIYQNLQTLMVSMNVKAMLADFHKFVTHKTIKSEMPTPNTNPASYYLVFDWSSLGQIGCWKRASTEGSIAGLF